MSITTGRWRVGVVGGGGGKTSESLVGKRTVKGGQAGRQRSPWSMDSYHHRAQLLSTAFQIPLTIARPRCRLTPHTHTHTASLQSTGPLGFFMRSQLSSEAQSSPDGPAGSLAAWRLCWTRDGSASRRPSQRRHITHSAPRARVSN